MDLIQSLKKIGFTQQEAILYIYLGKHGELTGYEAAKLSGISRSNAYAALSSLVDKGYAHVIQGTSAKYIAIPKEELIRNADRSFHENIAYINKHLEFDQTQQEAYITITGGQNIINKFKNIIAIAEERIYISCDKDILDKIENELKDAIGRGLKVVILSSTPINNIGDYIYYPASSSSESFKTIIDTKEVLAGTLKQSLYSKNKTLVALIKESFINEIAVIETKTKT